MTGALNFYNLNGCLLFSQCYRGTDDRDKKIHLRGAQKMLISLEYPLFKRRYQVVAD